MKKIFKGIGIALLCIAGAFGVFLGIATATEYSPAKVEPLEISGTANLPAPQKGGSVSVMSFNVGYGGLGKNEDFFMDGGSMVMPRSAEVVNGYLDGIKQGIQNNAADVYFLQEVDRDANRSYYIDEMPLLEQAGAQSVFAYNFKSMFTPYPVPPIGKAEAGLMTLSGLPLAGAERISLPVPFSWPVRLFNLKRCLLVSRAAVEGGGELVLVNLHLEAYDDGEGKKAQTEELKQFLLSEYEKGNYVIAGGDFNQSFPEADWPAVYEDVWTPGALDTAMLPEGWQLAADYSNPSCRLLNKPYSGNAADTQFFTIDGFIISPNVKLRSVETLDFDFEYSDHNPVYMKVDLA